MTSQVITRDQWCSFLSVDGGDGSKWWVCRQRIHTTQQGFEKILYKKIKREWNNVIRGLPNIILDFIFSAYEMNFLGKTVFDSCFFFLAKCAIQVKM